MKALAHLFAILVISSLLVAGCGTAAATKGRITITTKINFSAWRRAGAFEVSEGADILGCSTGSLETHLYLRPTHWS
jgi:hypothetical protein